MVVYGRLTVLHRTVVWCTVLCLTELSDGVSDLALRLNAGRHWKGYVVELGRILSASLVKVPRVGRYTYTYSL